MGGQKGASSKLGLKLKTNVMLQKAPVMTTPLLRKMMSPLTQAFTLGTFPETERKAARTLLQHLRSCSTTPRRESLKPSTRKS
ncbi:hypothetical protein JTE90_028737 [Oedothorax gibbosus]|uniref:Uncharacterized protein n=1 Tax=Oedothorax gibbosus TaxID=931172 RepID=A0AAV6UH80_9ARAC|nr:hypothetical protein JTE90_028737 [Oedothorax gibbosus]